MKTAKRPPTKLCPTCWNDMRWTKDGFVCPRHGLVAIRSSDMVVRSRVPSGSSTRKRRTHTPRPPRQSTQTDRLLEKHEEIIARNQAGESIAEIAADVWKELGYKDEHVCASKISYFLGRRNIRVADRRPGPAQGATSARRFTPERLNELRLALASGESVWSFAGAHWEEWGFTSRSSCDSLFRKWLRTKAAA